MDADAGAGIIPGNPAFVRLTHATCVTGYLTTNDTPGVHAKSWYAETGGEMPDHPELTGAQRADVSVVGAGYGGLSAALHLAERGLDVVLV